MTLFILVGGTSSSSSSLLLFLLLLWSSFPMSRRVALMERRMVVGIVVDIVAIANDTFIFALIWRRVLVVRRLQLLLIQWTWLFSLLLLLLLTLIMMLLQLFHLAFCRHYRHLC